jgi:predicted CoA-substrate-specific enzyme activase
VKLVLVRGGRVIHQEVRCHAHDPLATCRELLDGRHPDGLLATGYGRRLAQAQWGCPALTEIKAVAAGARHLRPACRTILDIGGQDTKAVALDGAGRTQGFEMNDKCAAGTGRFLEVMAMALGMTLDQFSGAALASPEAAPVNDMCTVFAESEVVSLAARGTPREALARGLHASVVRRAAALARRVGIQPDLLLCGGGGHNPCLRALLEEALGIPVWVPDQPQTVAALGAALMAAAGPGWTEETP